MSKIDEIQAREQDATTGPWIAAKYGETIWFTDEGGYEWKIASDLDENDAEFIAHAREDIPFLLGEVDRLTAQLQFKQGTQITYYCPECERQQNEVLMPTLEELNAWFDGWTAGASLATSEP